MKHFIGRTCTRKKNDTQSAAILAHTVVGRRIIWAAARCIGIYTRGIRRVYNNWGGSQTFQVGLHKLVVTRVMSRLHKKIEKGVCVAISAWSNHLFHPPPNVTGDILLVILLFLIKLLVANASLASKFQSTHDCFPFAVNTVNGTTGILAFFKPDASLAALATSSFSSSFVQALLVFLGASTHCNLFLGSLTRLLWLLILHSQ